MKIDRQKVYEKYNGHCAYCGESLVINNMQVDHLIPKANFGYHIKNNWRIPIGLGHLTIDDVNHIDNLMPSCRICNKWKSTFDLNLFRSEIASQVQRLNAYSSNYRMAKRYHLVSEIKKDIVFYFEIFSKLNTSQHYY